MEKRRLLLQRYLERLADVAMQGDAREESFYSTLENMLTEFAQTTNRTDLRVTVLPKKTEAGNPDFRVWNGTNRIVGYIEAKHVTQENLDAIEESEQVRRYREVFPNFILTNFLEFRLYRNGERVGSAMLARSLDLVRARLRLTTQTITELWTLLDCFLNFSLPQVLNAEALAIELAKRTRFLRDVVLQELNEEETNHHGDLLGFYEAFQKFLIGGLTQEDFADLYAQTITYGLFAARTRAGNGFNRRNAFDSIPRTIGILRDVFRYVSLGDLPVQLEWIVDDLSDVLAIADVSGILTRYYREHKGSDPIVHFYETFLARYDPEERERRGVYYTPEPVVDYIVRSLHLILKLHFDKPDGLAAEQVTLLDPAAGTMTFVARAAQEAVREFESKYGSGAREAFIRNCILRDFYAFELMMAPYAIGHLKMAFFLEELGHRLTDDERVRFYLTNTLDMTELEQSSLPGLSSLAEESRLAGRVKKEQPILVILGNPPYSGHSANRGKWIRDLIEDYKRIGDKPLGEKNPKWLQDDYVKFLRFAEWKIAQAGRGVVGMITNHSYLDNPTFRGMRWHLMQTFDEMYILDLHGNALKRESCPDGSPDENVFDIRQGVAIAFFIKKGIEKQTPTRVFHSDLWGRREDKYAWLSNHDFTNTDWREITPKPEFHLFVPRDTTRLECYKTFSRLTDVFLVYGASIVTARDHLTIHWTPEEVWATVLKFSRMDPELARQAYNLRRDARDWKVALAQEDLKRTGPDRQKIVPILYRPFDIRYTYYTGCSRGFHCMPRREVMRHMLAGGNLGLITVRKIPPTAQPRYVMVTTMPVVNGAIRSDNQSIDTIFPLYTCNDADQQNLFTEDKTAKRQPNLNSKIIAALENAYGKAPSPEGIFHYIYAVLYAPSYREQYTEFLRTDFPRVPFPRDPEVFKATAALGERLTRLHLLESPELDPPLTRFEGQGDNRVGRNKAEGLRHDAAQQRVHINVTQYFAPVPLETWEYQIGSYQVCDKWLKDRRGRRLNLEEIRTYCRIVTALTQTIAIQGEIDDLYPAIEKRPLAIDV